MTFYKAKRLLLTMPHLISGVPNYKLPTLKYFLGIEVGSHTAIEDCLVAGELYYYCKNVQGN